MPEFSSAVLPRQSPYCNILNYQSTTKVSRAAAGLTRDEKLKESWNDPLRIDDTDEDRSPEPGLRRGDPDAYGDPLETYPGDEIPRPG